MKVSQMIQHKFLCKGDLDEDTPATIKSLKLEDMPGDGGEQRWVVYFRKLQKGMVLNTTALRLLGQTFGDESDAWIGKKVVVYLDPTVLFKGQVVGGLRLWPVKPAKPKSAESIVRPPLEQGAAATAEPEFDDRIP
jgi:hypothetical protein